MPQLLERCKRWMLIFVTAWLLTLITPLTAQQPQHTSDTLFAYLPLILHSVELDINDRQSVVNFYVNNYVGSENIADGWTGDQASCNAGTTSQAFRDTVVKRINYYRRMAGMDKVTLDPTYNAKAQQAALMMSRNNKLNHTPPTTWFCYTVDGKTAAGSSNLAGGTYGANSIRAYMRDGGFVGHRRWILYPNTQQMGTGDVPSRSGFMSANALWVFGAPSTRPATRDEFVAWPPSGYVPYNVVYGLWSFSYKNANFSNAIVTMNQGANVIPVQITSRTDNGYGENTIVWLPQGYTEGATWANPVNDTTYTITVSNVVIGAQTRAFTYNVIIIDPSR